MDAQTSWQAFACTGNILRYLDYKQKQPEEATAAAKAVENWLFSLGVKQKLLDLGVQESDVEDFCNFIEQTPSLGLLLSVAPVMSSRQRLARIYTNSLRPMP